MPPRHTTPLLSSSIIMSVTVWGTFAFVHFLLFCLCTLRFNTSPALLFSVFLPASLSISLRVFLPFSQSACLSLSVFVSVCLSFSVSLPILLSSTLLFCNLAFVHWLIESFSPFIHLLSLSFIRSHVRSTTPPFSHLWIIISLSFFRAC